MGILRRGYAIISNDEGRTISSIKQVQLGEGIRARLVDGLINATVNTKKPIEEMRNGKAK
jgi:exodeoxyribonuclease VII large subunit